MNYSGLFNLELLAAINTKLTRNEIKKVMELVGLGDAIKKRVGAYSLGMRQRLGIAQAIMEKPEILILDEPMNGLDKHGVKEIREVLLRMKEENRVILLSSHNPKDIDYLCDVVFEMDDGYLQEMNDAKINKVIALLAVLGILAGSGNVVYGNEENIADQEEQLTKEKESIYIDNTGCYEGMETSYSEGYVPEITENEVKIVLPLLVKGNLKEKKLHVHPDLGSATQAPYVYKNYDKDVVEEEKTISTGEVRKVYYVSILLQLKEEREAGTYPINWEVTGILENGETLTQTFSTYVNIDAKKNESSEDNPADQEIPGTDTNEQNPGNIAVDGDTGGGSSVENTGETATEVKHNPKLLHIETKCNKKTVEPGDKIKLELTFQNKSKKETIRNVALRVESNNENVAIRNKTNTWYFENIAPQEKITVKVSAQINLGVEGEFVDFNYTEQYDDKDGEQKEETGTIAVTLTRLPKIQWEITALNDVVYAGDRIALSGNIMNVGQGKAYNVNVTMEVPGLHLEKTMFAGEVEKGTSAEIDGAVLVDGKPDKEKYGNTEGNLIITYTDETGKEYQDTLGVITEIQPPVIVTDTGTEDNSKRSLQWWMICFVSVECILVAAVYYFVKRRKK